MTAWDYNHYNKNQEKHSIAKRLKMDEQSEKSQLFDALKNGKARNSQAALEITKILLEKRPKQKKQIDKNDYESIVSKTFWQVLTAINADELNLMNNFAENSLFDMAKQEEIADLLDFMEWTDFYGKFEEWANPAFQNKLKDSKNAEIKGKILEKLVEFMKKNKNQIKNITIKDLKPMMLWFINDYGDELENDVVTKILDMKDTDYEVGKDIESWKVKIRSNLRMARVLVGIMIHSLLLWFVSQETQAKND